MATSHHGGESQPINPELERTLKRLADQFDGRAKREYPRGRVHANDDGELAMACTADVQHGIVVLDFGKAVKWIGLPPKEVVALCKILLEKARQVSKEPIVLSL